MYFPYLRGKPFELTTIKETAELSAAHNKFVPILEPVSIRGLKNALAHCQKLDSPIVMVTNPKYGEFAKENGILGQLADLFEDFPKLTLAYLLSERTSKEDLLGFDKRYTGRSKAVIHNFPFNDPKFVTTLDEIGLHVFLDGATGQEYKNAFAKFNRVKLSDGFKKRKNAEYPEQEYFSDLYKTYGADKYYGFGDFLIVGDIFEKGFAAYAVALHLTYLSENGDVWARHFISDRKETIADQPGKFLEALAKLDAYLEANPNLLEFSSGCREYRDIYHEQDYRGLGYPKKLSMRHHIELMNSVL